MKLNKTARILASLALGLSLCVVSCEKPATNIVIAPPNTHPSTGTGTGNGNGNGETWKRTDINHPASDPSGIQNRIIADHCGFF